MNKQLFAIGVMAILVISVASVGLGAADSEDSQTQNVRNLWINEGVQSIFVRSDIKQGNVENHFGLLFNTAHGVVIRIAFNHEEEETASDLENSGHFHMLIAYINLVEYNDTNGNSAFDKGVDTVIQRVPLWNLSYSMPTWTDVTSSDGKHGYEIKTQTTNAPFTFKVTADIFSEYALVNGTIVQPNATKITTEIDNFPFQHITSRLSLQVIAVSQTKVETETAQMEQNIRVRSATANGYFKIDPSATVDGNSVQAVTSVNSYSVISACELIKRPEVAEQCLESANKGVGPLAVISISFPYGKTIIHDPILGIELTSPTPLLTAPLLAAAAIASIAVFGLLVYAGRRQLARVFYPQHATI